MRVEVNLRSSEVDIPQLAVEWFEMATCEIFGPLLEELRNGPDLHIPGKGESMMVGPPGGVWASLTQQDPLWGRLRSRNPWSETNWSRFLAKVAQRPASSGFWN
ncbi:hypothetical protein GCM10011579_086610 [Streptomyces albiflavescens]|uniref:Uncharacterized protein n=1 Tax=Streptomyces albiflavescens TaxID=1623582 RepID=A0A917YDL7_9ACTN|nr:hypothetical protein GCM10011579_086610 [Streptomyces albiflavescens]